MTREQVKKIIGLLSETWNAKFNALKTEIYGENLADLEYKKCCSAIKKLVQTSEFLPSIALIRRTYVELEQEILDDASAYELLKDAIQTYGIYSSREALEYIQKQNEIVYELIKKIGWRELCMCPQEFLANKFIKIYQDFSAAKIKSEIISPRLAKELDDVRAQIQRASFALLEGGEVV